MLSFLHPLISCVYIFVVTLNFGSIMFWLFRCYCFILMKRKWMEKQIMLNDLDCITNVNVNQI
jgi:hypothetical protein